MYDNFMPMNKLCVLLLFFFTHSYLQTHTFVTSEYQILSIMWPANEGKKKSL